MLLTQLLNRVVKSGQLRVIDSKGRVHRFGDPRADPIVIRLRDNAVQRKLLASPALAFGEAYMDGRLTIEKGDLRGLIDLYTRNDSDSITHPLGRIANRLSIALRRLHQYNPVHRAQANVAHHYDLSGALYDLFLDTDRQYSCAYFRDPAETLEAAQANKKRHIAAKLRLEPGQRILDIGCGWGGLALYLAEVAGADVTGITLSREQWETANRRSRDARLDKRTRFFLRDYREETGRYDRIVSVGMFEHVGVGHYREYFDKVRDLLTEDGVFLLHSIGRMGPPGNTNAWLRKYIFPGGYSPALSETLAAVEKAGLWVTDIEILRLHYAETLRRWHDRFQANRDKVRALYDERFCRMWEFYLVGCEYAFRNWDQMVFQMQITRRPDAVPLTRDYMVDWERAHSGLSAAAQ